METTPTKLGVMSALPPPPSSHDALVVMTVAKLHALIDEAVERAVDRAVRRVADELRAGRGSEWLRSQQAEVAYGVSRTTLYRWRKVGRVEWRRIGGVVYYLAPGSGSEDPEGA